MLGDFYNTLIFSKRSWTEEHSKIFCFVSTFNKTCVATISANSYSYSPFYCCSSSLKIYCEGSAKQSGWGTYWNYYASGSTLTTYYSCTRDEAGNIYYSDGSMAVAASTQSSLTNTTLDFGNSQVGQMMAASPALLAYVKRKEDNDYLDIPNINKTTSL